MRWGLLYASRRGRDVLPILDVATGLARGEIRQLYQSIGEFDSWAVCTARQAVLIAAIHARSLAFRRLPGQTLEVLAVRGWGRAAYVKRGDR